MTESIGKRLDRIERAARAPRYVERIEREFDWDGFFKLLRAHDVAVCRPDADTPPETVRANAAAHVRHTHEQYSFRYPMPSEQQIAAEATELADWIIGLSPRQWWQQVCLTGYDGIWRDRCPAGVELEASQ
jgi:hypothetical protein